MRPRLIPAVFAALATGLLARPALAQTAPDPTGTLIAELVVNARAPGPAWWRVSKGEAVVYVMGVPEFAPKDVAFDDSLLRKRLDGADRLILPPAPKVDAFSLMGFMLQLKRLEQKTPLSSTLPPEMAARLAAVLKARGDKPDELDDLKPAFAGFTLSNGDGHDDHVAIDMGGLPKRIEALARSADIHAKPRIVSTGGYNILGQIVALAVLPQDVQLACLDDGLRTAERGEGGTIDVSRKWAVGRVRDVVDADRGFESCLTRSPDGARDVIRRIGASERAIRDALKRPGFSVAVVDLRLLLAQDGVLDRLRKAGYAVVPPGG